MPLISRGKNAHPQSTVYLVTLTYIDDRWDFPMLAMSAARNGNPDMAVDWLLNPLFTFDDVGMPGGGVQVPSPYFPGAGALLLAIAMMAAGWDGSTGRAPGFPEVGWNIAIEGIAKSF